jgi:mannose-6-phosphate isomerase-like protein (cupin superfamily)
MPSTVDLASTYLCLSPSGAVTPLPVTPDFRSTIGSRTELQEGRLMAAFACTTDWGHWEMHPNGEEVLVMLSGDVTLVLDTARGDEAVRLLQGQAFVVPRGVWHRAVVHAPGTMIGLTYGRGTEHRPR